MVKIPRNSSLPGRLKLAKNEEKTDQTFEVIITKTEEKTKELAQLIEKSKTAKRETSRIKAKPSDLECGRNWTSNIPYLPVIP